MALKAQKNLLMSSKKIRDYCEGGSTKSKRSKEIYK